LLPDLLRSVGLGPVSSPPSGGLAKGGVDQRPRPVDLVGPVEFGQQQGMQLLPDPRPVPEAQVVAARLAAAAAEVGGQVVPGDAGLGHEQDAGEDLAVVQRLAAGEAEAARGRRGQQGLELLPQGIAHQRFHGGLLGF